MFIHHLCPKFTSLFTHLAPKHDSLLLYALFWVIPRRLNFICRRFETLCLFHLHRQVGVEFYTYPPVKMEQAECSETSAYKIQTPGNYPEESIQHSQHGESLKLSIMAYFHRTQSQIKIIRKNANFICHLWFVVPCIFKSLIKQPTRCTLSCKIFYCLNAA
jgi:hypothetical protein